MSTAAVWAGTRPPTHAVNFITITRQPSKIVNQLVGFEVAARATRHTLARLFYFCDSSLRMEGQNTIEILRVCHLSREGVQKNMLGYIN